MLILALGCASTSLETEPSVPEPTQTRPELPPIAESAEPDEGIHDAFPALAPVYFDTDLATLRPDARNTLETYTKAILEHPEWGVLRIEGHCDERGSAEHNRALGERRAAVIKRHLVEMGIPSSRLTTQTFGAEMPAVRGHDESAWRLNRRSELHRSVGA